MLYPPLSCYISVLLRSLSLRELQRGLILAGKWTAGGLELGMWLHLAWRGELVAEGGILPPARNDVVTLGVPHDGATLSKERSALVTRPSPGPLPSASGGHPVVVCHEGR